MRLKLLCLTAGAIPTILTAFFLSLPPYFEFLYCYSSSTTTSVANSLSSSFLTTLYDCLETWRGTEHADTLVTLLHSNKAWVLNNTAANATWPPAQAYGLALGLAVHVLHRLTAAAAERGDDNPGAARLLVGWADLLHQHLFIEDGVSWYKASGSLRQFGSRLVATVTGAALLGLEQAADQWDVRWHATRLLQQILDAEDGSEKNSSTRPYPDWDETSDAELLEAYQRSLAALSNYLEEGSWTLALLEYNADEPSLCEWTEVEWNLLREITNHDKDLRSKGSTAKASTTQVSSRTRRHDEGAASSGSADSWAALQRAYPVPNLEGRSRRGAAVFMDWCWQAAPRLLVQVQSVLTTPGDVPDLADDGWVVRANVHPLLWANHIGRILATASQRSGYRPPSSLGDFENYLRELAPVAWRSNKGKGSKKLVKPDVRDATLRTLHTLLVAHVPCVVGMRNNDDGQKGLNYCLWISETIQDYNNAAADSLSSSEKGECLNRLYNAVLSYLPSLFGTGPDQDWRLRRYGLIYLQNILLSVSSAPPTNFIAQMVEAPGPLPDPRVASAATKKKKTDTSLFTYSGLYQKVDNGTASFEKIALHLRGYLAVPAISGNSRTKSSKKQAGSVGKVGEIAMLHWLALMENALQESAPTPTKVKDSPSPTSRPRKRQKQDETEEDSPDEEEKPAASVTADPGRYVLYC